MCMTHAATWRADTASQRMKTHLWVHESDPVLVHRVCRPCAARCGPIHGQPIVELGELVDILDQGGSDERHCSRWNVVIVVHQSETI